MLPRVLWYCYALSRSQWLKPSTVQQLQLKRLQAMLRHAYATVPLYRRKFDAVGLNPDDICTMADLSKLPVTTKQDIIQDLPGQCLAQGYTLDACVRWGSSGTTGGSMPVYYDRRFFDYVVAERYYRQIKAMGCNPWDKTMQILFHMPEPVGAPLEEAPRPSRRRASLGSSASLFRRWYKPAFIAYSADEIIQNLIAYQPGILAGSPSYLRLAAEAVAEKCISDLHLKAVWSVGEVLDEPTRQFLESTFGCLVFDTYGAAEVGSIAQECQRKEGLHILSDCLIVEILRNGEPAAPGELGDIVVTGLLNYAMPIIRYRVGDVGILAGEPCSCGRGFPMLRSVEGRVVDCFSLPDGRTVTPKTIMTTVQGTPGVSRYRVVQERQNKVSIAVMQRPSDSPVSREELIARCRHVLGDEVDIAVVVRGREHLKAKFRPVISQLTVDREPRWTEPYQKAIVS